MKYKASVRAEQSTGMDYQTWKKKSKIENRSLLNHSLCTSLSEMLQFFCQIPEYPLTNSCNICYSL